MSNQIPQMYKHYGQQRPNIIKDKNNAAEIFQFLVRKLLALDFQDNFYTFNQLSRMIFYESDSGMLKRVFREYKPFFILKVQKRKLDVPKIWEQHPEIWPGYNPEIRFSIDSIKKAIYHEIEEVKRMPSHPIFLSEIEPLKNSTSFIYHANITADTDNFLSLEEGQRIKLVFKNGAYIFATILEYLTKEDKLFFKTDSSIEHTSAVFRVNTFGILYKMIDALEKINEPKSGPLYELIHNPKMLPQKVAVVNAVETDKLDESQKNAVNESLQNNVNYIWGPPGTGKSFTLARILLNLFLRKEKTIVCSVANVAVDGLLEKTVELIREYNYNTGSKILKDAKIVRLGYAQSDRVRNIKEVQLNNPEIEDLAYRIGELRDKKLSIQEDESLEKEERQRKSVKITALIDELKIKYDKALRLHISEAKLIFLTSAKFISDSTLQAMNFDNIVVDEGSMMALPQLLILAQNISKRIIVAGDFKQLGPIAVAKSTLAIRWLHNDLFSLLGKYPTKHKALSMIIYQRRSAKEIAELINKPFYNGHLITKNGKEHDLAVYNSPKNGHVNILALPNNADYGVEFSRNHSKYNRGSRAKVIELIHTLLSEFRMFKSIGIITPYRQQVIDYKKDLEIIESNEVKIRVGTIHTFQGSECDIIIWDITDAPNQKVGALYQGKTGERLVNVAISRAKSKLIIVGYPRFFHECTGRDVVSQNIKNIMNQAFNLNQKIHYTQQN